DVLGGYQALGLTEDLCIHESYTGVPGTAAAGLSGTSHDHFRTRNLFQGLYVGLAGEHQINRWLVGWTGKLALGYNDRTLQISGMSELTLPGGQTTTTPGGLLAVASNSGTYHSASPVFLPELGVNLGYRVTERFVVRVGYSFLYWDRVWRPGEQVDTTINPAYLAPGNNSATPVRPVALQSDSSLFVHGLNLGAELRF
ncbi:MAG: BBP7 family outer membrane beta-barrel protein, partial [Gemmataceae bacterium]